ncbi:MAG: tautomerase family protein [Lachnospirales bacterium]
MPAIHITLKEGLDRSQKRDLIKKVTTAVTDITQVSEQAVSIIIDEQPSDNFGSGGMQLTDILEARGRA